MQDSIMWSPGMTLDAVEKLVILKAFRFYRGVKTTTAQSLGISIRTLDAKLEKYQSDENELERVDEQRRTDRDKFLARQRGVVLTSQETGASVLGSDAGVRVEPASQSISQSDMPVPKRREVQTVLPGQASKSGAHKHR